MLTILDLGTSKITGISVSTENHQSKVEAFSYRPTSGLKRGSIINITETSQAIKEVTTDLQQQSGGKVRDIQISFSGEQISSRNNSGVSKISDREVSHTDMHAALQSALVMHIPSEKEMLNVIPSEYTIDGQPGIKEPKGMTGVRLEVRAHVIYSSKNSISNIKKCVEEMNDLNINKYFYSQVGAAKCILSSDQMDLGVCLIDIGAGTSDITVYKNGCLIFSKVLPYAGDYITEDIASSLKISLSQAEEIKKKYGSAISKNIPDEMLKTNGINGKIDNKVSRRMLCEVIEQSVSNIIRSVMQNIEDSGLKDVLSAGYVITGGTANLQEIEDLGAIITQNSFRIGNPGHHLPLNSEKIILPQFAAPLGMVKYCIEEQNKEFTFNQSKGIIARVLDWLKNNM